MRPRSLRKECMLAKPVSSDHTGTLKLLTATATAANANGTLSPISCPFHSQPQLESCVCRECQIFQAGSMVLCVARCEMLRARGNPVTRWRVNETRSGRAQGFLT